MWVNPNSVDKDNFHKHFRQRLNDQYVQNWNSKLRNSTRFKTIQMLHTDYKTENYITKIKNPKIREIFTRLRVDLNVLSSSKSRGVSQLEICPCCNSETETVDHFLLKCVRFNDIRQSFFNELSVRDTNNFFNNLGGIDKLKYILNVDCPAEAIGTCCKFLDNIYSERISEGSPTAT